MCVDESYSVPLDVEFNVEVKPRSLSGVLFSVFSHGAGPPGGDFLVLQLVNGQVRHSPRPGLSQTNEINSLDVDVVVVKWRAQAKASMPASYIPKYNY